MCPRAEASRRARVRRLGSARQLRHARGHAVERLGHARFRRGLGGPPSAWRWPWASARCRLPGVSLSARAEMSDVTRPPSIFPSQITACVACPQVNFRTHKSQITRTKIMASIEPVQSSPQSQSECPRARPSQDPGPWTLPGDPARSCHSGTYTQRGKSRQTSRGSLQRSPPSHTAEPLATSWIVHLSTFTCGTIGASLRDIVYCVSSS